MDLLSKLMPLEEKSRQDVSLYLITDGLDNVSSEEERERFKEKIQNWKGKRLEDSSLGSQTTELNQLKGDWIYAKNKL